MGIFSRLSKARADPKNWTLTEGYPEWLTGKTNSGATVTPKKAVQLTAVYCCVKILAEAMAELPLQMYEYQPNGNKRKAYEHPLYTLLHDEPNPEMTSFVFRETLMAHLCLWGNAYVQIVRNGFGKIIGLYPLLPWNMEVDRGDDGKIYYKYDMSDSEDSAKNPDGKKIVVLPAEEVLHIPALGFNGLVGFSPIAMERNAIGSALTADEYSGKFFANSATPSGVIESPHAIRDITKFREKFDAGFSGAMNAGKTAVLEEGMTYKPVSISPADAQYLETRKFNVNEIARIFRIPPHMLADLEKSSFSNIEQQSLEFVKYTLAPWVARIEQSLKKALLTEEEKKRYFFSFNLEGLLRGDYQSRMAGYQIAITNGWMCPNDIRELENMNLIPEEEGGNTFMVNGAMEKLSQVGAAYEKNS